MKCSQCGADFEGKFCPECGKKVETPTSLKEGKVKKKKPFYRRWWFVLLAIIAVLFVAGKIDDVKSRINWKDVELIGVIPAPPTRSGTVYENSDEELDASLENVSDKQYNNYLKECVDKGFDVDADKSSGSYKAYNKEGYSLNMDHYGEYLHITLKAPRDFGTIKWPLSTAGGLLPIPESTTGEFSYEYEDSFFVYVAETSKDAYVAYVADCADSGFDVDYNKGDTYYYAKNADGWSISLRYEGNSVMSICIDAPKVEETETAESEEKVAETTKPEEEVAETVESEEVKTEEAIEVNGNTGIDADFKAAMDSYEAFYTEYCDFMKKYFENPTDLTLLLKYSDMLSEAEKMDKTFAEWDNGELNEEELKYYIEVNARVLEMLVDIAG